MANANVNQGIEGDILFDEGADLNDIEEVDLLEIQQRGIKVCMAGVSTSGVVYLQGNLHVYGSAVALLLAAKEQVPYISTSDGNVMFPADWLRHKCQFEPDRLHVIDNLERFVRAPMAG